MMKLAEEDKKLTAMLDALKAHEDEIALFGNEIQELRKSRATDIEAAIQVGKTLDTAKTDTAISKLTEKRQQARETIETIQSGIKKQKEVVLEAERLARADFVSSQCFAERKHLEDFLKAVEKHLVPAWKASRGAGIVPYPNLNNYLDSLSERFPVEFHEIQERAPEDPSTPLSINLKWEDRNTYVAPSSGRGGRPTPIWRRR